MGSGGNGSLSGEGNSGKMESAHLNGQHCGTENIQMYEKTNKRKPRFVCWPSKTYFRSKPAYCNLNLALPASQGFSCRIRGVTFYVMGYFTERFLSMELTLGKTLHTKCISYFFLKISIEV